MSKHGKYSTHKYYKHFGSWNKFLESIDESLFLKYNNNVTKQDLIDNYYFVKKELGRPPRAIDMSKHGKYNKHQYIKHFGTWNKFLDSIDEPLLRS